MEWHFLSLQRKKLCNIRNTYMETNADPILITVGGMKNLPYQGWGEGGIVRISVIADQVLYQTCRLFSIQAAVVWLEFRKKGVITQKDYRVWIPVVYCNFHFKKSNMREVRQTLWWIQISISAIALKKKTRCLVLNGHETFFLLKKRIYRSKSQAIICKSRPLRQLYCFSSS